MAAQLVTLAAQIFPKLDHLSYYDLLGLSATANEGQIKAAFYRVSRDLHPDRYHMLPDRELRDRLESIYARICEGYRVLTSPEGEPRTPKRSARARSG